MALPRKRYVREGEEGVYHCFTRCVRRAFLCGRDSVTQRDYSHRKVLIVDRLRALTAIFAIEVCAYAIMENHYHVILRICADIVASWSDREVAARWLTLFPRGGGLKGASGSIIEKQISALAECTERITELRKRLCNLSWFMGRLNEFIARAANKEDDVKGRFWESRFKCQALLDEAAITACMVYVDLNPIRAGLAATPEDSDFTSIQERIRTWFKKDMVTCSASIANGQNIQRHPAETDMTDTSPIDSFEVIPESWLCPIQSNSERRGILQITAAEYFDLVDRSGRILYSGKRGSIDADLEPILLRIGVNPGAWLDTISSFESKFRLAAGLLSSLRRHAEQLGRRWFMGIAAARIAFVATPQSV